jgi:hypothetical protein
VKTAAIAGLLFSPGRKIREQISRSLVPFLLGKRERAVSCRFGTPPVEKIYHA